MVFCDCAYTQPGNIDSKIGAMAKAGYPAGQLREVCASQTARGIDAAIVDLRVEAAAKGTPASEVKLMADAVVLVIRNGANALTNDPDMADKMLAEHQGLDYDEFTKPRKEVLTARSRRMLFFAEEGCPADMAKGLNTVIPWSSVPANAKCHHALKELLGTTDANYAVASHYFDTKEGGIGWHGDAERRQTIMVRLGAVSNTRPLHFVWCHKSKSISPPITIELQHGDVVVFSEKAMGTDWRCSSILTVKHGTGCPTGNSVLKKLPGAAKKRKRV